MRHTAVTAGTWLCLLGSFATAEASFHFMQIERVIGGAGGDATVQAVQLRMRASFQNELQFARMRVWDAAGQNPILFIDFTDSLPNGALGARVLITTPNFEAMTGLVGDFTLPSLIPVSYLAAGSLTFEDDNGNIYWRLSWGGAGYTGSHLGLPTNDSNGNFGPAYAGPLPHSGTQALRFIFTSTALSTTNAADYALLDPGVFFNNSGESATVVAPRRGDFDYDDDVNLVDAEILADCMTGPNKPVLPACAALGFRGGDLDTDGDIDLRDAHAFQQVFSPSPD